MTPLCFTSFHMLASCSHRVSNQRLPFWSAAPRRRFAFFTSEALATFSANLGANVRPAFSFISFTSSTSPTPTPSAAPSAGPPVRDASLPSLPRLVGRGFSRDINPAAKPHSFRGVFSASIAFFTGRARESKLRRVLSALRPVGRGFSRDKTLRRRRIWLAVPFPRLLVFLSFASFASYPSLHGAIRLNNPSLKTTL